jgi:hypothetical protein
MCQRPWWRGFGGFLACELTEIHGTVEKEKVQLAITIILSCVLPKKKQKI